MKVLRHVAPALLLVALSATKIISAGEFLPIVNPTFANVPIQCSGGYAYQGLPGATCTSQSFPAQAFDGTPGMGWALLPPETVAEAPGLTDPNTAFNPPPFSGLPFSRAAFLQGPNCEVAQTIFGFVSEQPYRLAFYLGSRYNNAPNFGNQTVVALIDHEIIGTWALVPFTPFIIHNVFFKVADSGPHTLRFVGITAGPGTAFLSGVSIRAVDAPDTE